MPYRACTVSLVEGGKRYEVKVDAESAYAAAVLALKQFSKNRDLKGPNRRAVLEVQVVRPVCIKMEVGDVLDWLFRRTARTPEQRERKDQLKTLLVDDQRR